MEGTIEEGLVLIPTILPIFMGYLVSKALLFEVILSPFAALTCWLIARSRGLSQYRYAAAGALYSILFILPLIYLVLRMYGRSVPIGVIDSLAIRLFRAGPVS